MKQDEYKQKVRLPAIQASSLKGEDLALALAYEVEPFSKIPAAEAKVTFSEVPDSDTTVRVFDVTVSRRGRKMSGKGSRLSAERLIFPAVIAAAIVLSGIAADYFIMRNRLAAAERETSIRTPLDKQIKQMKSATAKACAEAEEIAAKRNQFEGAQKEAARLRRAHAGLLSAISDSFGGETVIRSMTKQGAGVTIKAISATVTDASKAMTTLTRKAAGYGWRVMPNETSVNPATLTAEITFSAIFSEGGVK